MLLKIGSLFLISLNLSLVSCQFQYDPIRLQKQYARALNQSQRKQLTSDESLQLLNLYQDYEVLRDFYVQFVRGFDPTSNGLVNITQPCADQFAELGVALAQGNNAWANEGKLKDRNLIRSAFDNINKIFLF